ncbi:MAG: aldehyde dehydrogenase family protein [Kineosporiaceae bacterium]|nr:aldehyde dehydrogenase family protein [Aeromicrobium sp.]
MPSPSCAANSRRVVAYGGEKREGVGVFVNPALLTNVRNDMDVASNKVFGPIFCVSGQGRLLMSRRSRTH